jgi:predicted aminopeptidase
MLQFAEQDLQLDVGGRYQSYVGLKRDHVVWNVFVAPALVMRSEQWCYPLIGCAPYRGYFGKSDAEALAAVYAAKGFDTYVGGVSAYSTLGWFDDPLLSSFVFYSEPALANLLFHELAHSKAWVKGDVAFNESFASFVGVQGAQHWLSLNNDSASRSLARWRQSQAEWQRFKSFALDAKADFATLYNGQSGSVEQRLQQRERARAHWQQCYERHLQELGAGRFDRLMGENFNNALLMSLGTYEDWVGAFAQLFVDVEKDWQGFFTGVLALTALSAQERLQRMQVLRQRYLLQQQDTQEADHQNTKQIQCQPFSNHLLN